MMKIKYAFIKVKECVMEKYNEVELIAWGVTAMPLVWGLASLADSINGSGASWNLFELIDMLIDMVLSKVHYV